MACEIDDEDVKLIAEALSNAGWHITTHHNEKKADEDLKRILMALIEAKVQELPTVQHPSLTPNEATALLSASLKSAGVTDYEVETSYPEMVEHYELGMKHKFHMAKGYATVSLTIKGLSKERLAAWINTIRQADSWAN